MTNQKPNIRKSSRDKESRKFDKIVGAKLTKLRKDKGLSIRNLGNVLGLSEAAICYYEKGKNRISTHMLLQICIIFGVGPNHFYKDFLSSEIMQGDNNA